MPQSDYVWLDDEGALMVCPLQNAQAAWTVVAEVVENGEDPNVALRNPFANLHSLFWPDNMFGPARSKLSKLREFYAAHP